MKKGEGVEKSIQWITLCISFLFSIICFSFYLFYRNSTWYQSMKALKITFWSWKKFACITSITFNENMTPIKMSDILVPSHLKFLSSNMKGFINTPLTVENYLLYKSQIIKLFVTNRFHGYLDGSTQKTFNTNTRWIR